MTHLEIITSHKPLVLLRTRGQPSDEEHAAGLRRLSELLGVTRNVMFIFEDAGNATLTRQQRIHQSRWMTDESARLADNCLGIAFVFPSAGARFVLSTILLLSGTPVSHKVVGTMQEALAWVKDRLLQAGVQWSAPTSF